MIQMQVAKIIISLIFITGMSCSKSGRINSDIKQETSQVTKEKTKNGYCVIVGHCYGFVSKEDIIPAGLNINGVVLETNNGFFEYNVWPGNHEIRVGFIGKKWISKSVKIEKGDSVNVKFYLKDDDTPLHEK